MKTGIELISEERQRQISQEGWTAEHNDEHCNEQLAYAAACYTVPATTRRKMSLVTLLWPWEMSWWKPSPENRVRELVKAGALIAAEIDRLQRMEANK